MATKLRLRTESVAKWTTATAQIKTNERCVVHSSLSEFSPMGTVAWYMHINILNNVHYDMAIENDLIERLKINIKDSTSTDEWQGLEIPMRSRNATLEDI
jgi:hypothetical protein